MAAGDGSLTLAFDVAALRRLRDPGEVVADARTWADHVGVVTTDALPALTKFTRDNGLDPDFTSGPTGVDAETLSDAMAAHETDRYVYVGTTDDHRELATAAGWEYRSVEDAASAAEWRLQYAAPDRTVVTEDRRDDWP